MIFREPDNLTNIYNLAVFLQESSQKLIDNKDAEFVDQATKKTAFDRYSLSAYLYNYLRRIRPPRANSFRSNDMGTGKEHETITKAADTRFTVVRENESFLRSKVEVKEAAPQAVRTLSKEERMKILQKFASEETEKQKREIQEREEAKRQREILAQMDRERDEAMRRYMAETKQTETANGEKKVKGHLNDFGTT